MAFIQLLSFEPLKWLLLSIISYFIYVHLLKPFIQLAHMVIHYRSFPTTPSNLLLGHFNQIWTNFPFPSNLESMQINFHEIFDKIVARNPGQPIVTLWLSLYPVINAVSHELVEIVFNKKNLTRPKFANYIDLGEGLATSGPEIWKVRRRLIEPFFSTKKLRSHVKTMNKEVESFSQKLDSEVGKPFDLEHQIHISTLNIILKTTLSIPLDDLIEEKKDLLELINTLEPNAVKRGLNPLYYLDWMLPFTEFGRFYNKTNYVTAQLIDKIYAHKKQMLSSSSNEGEDQDFVDMLEGKVDKKGMHDELKTIIGTGHDTTALGFRWLTFNLGNHQEIQERLYQEIIQFFPDDAPVDDLDKINQCTFLDQCVKESLRINPIVVGISRFIEDDIMVKDKKILKGSMVALPFGSIHNNPSIYPEPDKFDPDRWSPDKAAKIPKNAFIPFGHGPRICIGWRYATIELKIYTIHTIRKFNVRSVRKHGSIRVKCDVTSKPVLPLEVILTPRNRSQKIKS